MSVLSGDELEIVFLRLCNPFDPRVAMAFSSASRGLWAPTQVARQQLRVQSEAAAALCRRAGIPSCKKLREATTARWSNLAELSIAELAMLGTLGSVVPSLKSLYLFDNVAASGGMRRLAEGLGAGALPAVTRLVLGSMRMGDAGAAALAAALGRGALPQLEGLSLGDNGIGDAGLVALAPALRRLSALKQLWLVGNPVGDRGLAALMAPPLTAALKQLEVLNMDRTQVTDAGCAILMSALNRDHVVMPALERVLMVGSAASAAMRVAVREALLARERARRQRSVDVSRRV